MKLLRNQRGQGLTEYLILLLLISVVSIGAVRSLGGTIKRKIQSTRKQINGMKADKADDKSSDDSNEKDDES